MANTLFADPILRKHCQFWFYFYDSGKSLGLSAGQFRKALTQKVEELDPEGRDKALRNMVIIGHSQGGLLTKLTAVDTGEKIVRQVTGKGLSELDLTEEQREFLRKRTVYKPLPFVQRVVFISTPHRGSFLAGDWVRNLVRRLVLFARGHCQSRRLSWGKRWHAAEVPEEWRS